MILNNSTISSINDLSNIIKDLGEEGKKFILRGQTEDWSLLPLIARKQPISIDIEKRIFDEFKRKCILYFQAIGRDSVSFPTNDFEWLVLGQHYGLKTRCSDWTQSVEVALFFAVEGAIDKNGVIWVYELPSNESAEWLPLGHRDVIKKSPFEFTGIKIYHPKSFLDSRTDNQLAVSIIHPFPWDSLMKDDKRFKKFSVASRSKKQIREELDKQGINYAHLFGGIEGICRHINSEYVG